MKLFLTPYACSLAVDIVAREAGIPLQLEWVDVRAKKLKDGSDYFLVNPKGQVPTLLMDDGQLVTEGMVIVQVLADSKPDSGLLPHETAMPRYRVLEWLSFISSELHKGFTPLFRPTTPPEYRVLAIENLHKRLAWLNQVLTDREYLELGRFTVADAYCYAIVIWSRLHKLPLDAYPSLVAYLDRIESRPSVKAALEAERAEVASRPKA